MISLKASSLSQLGVGAVAAMATAPSTPDKWVGMVISVVTIVTSVLLSGLVQHWLSRGQDLKNEADANRTNEMSQGEHLKNTSRLLDLKETEIQVLRTKVENLSREVAGMRQEIASLKSENAQLTLLLGAKLKELFQVQSLRDVFDAMEEVGGSGEKAGD